MRSSSITTSGRRHRRRQVFSSDVLTSWSGLFKPLPTGGGVVAGESGSGPDRAARRKARRQKWATWRAAWLEKRSAWHRQANRLCYRSAVWLARKVGGVREREFHHEGIKIAYDESGRRDRPTLVMVPGFASNKDYFLTLARLMHRKYHVVVPDLPGFGRSGKPEDATYSLEQYGEWMAEFLKSFEKEDLHYLGNSFGGAIGMEVALHHGSLFKTLTLVATGGVRPDKSPSVYDEIERGENPFAAESLEDYECFIKRVLHAPCRMLPPLRAHLGARMVEDSPWFAKILRDLTGSSADPENQDWEISNCAFNSRLRRISQPTLVVWGAEDRFLPPEIGEICKREIPKSELKILPGVGHCPQCEAPAALADHYLSFLGKHTGDTEAWGQQQAA